jgi:hypothetical protein
MDNKSVRELEFFIPGKPLPKERPRVAPHGGVYTPKQTADEEKRLAAFWHDLAVPPWEGLCGVDLMYTPEGTDVRIFDFNIILKSKHPRGDLDNLIKLTLDGLQRGGAFDDRQVYSIAAEK